MASDFYQPPSDIIPVFPIENILETQPVQTDIDLEEGKKSSVEEKDRFSFQPFPGELNLAHFFPDGADQGDIFQSYAGKAFLDLVGQDEKWMSTIYGYAKMKPEEMASRLGQPQHRVLGAYNPKDDLHDPDQPDTWIIHSFRNIRTDVVDGDGKPISLYSNAIEIMSAANVYTYYKNAEDHELFRSYVRSLWDKSHAYSVGMSDIYYCDGCLDDEEGEQEESSEAPLSAQEESDSETVEAFSVSEEPKGETEENGEDPNAQITGPEIAAASPSNAEDLMSRSETEEGSVPKGSCPGHVDLLVHIRIRGMKEKNGLFSVDPYGNEKKNFEENGWQGWTPEAMDTAKNLAGQDWYQKYGMTVASISLGNPLSGYEIEEYMQRLPENLSQTRREIIRFALSSVGQVPYHLGGKASGPGYLKNGFGALVSPDQKGRVLKGLDCSGWINWVYWSVTGSPLKYESTSGLATCGSPVSQKDLQPGDIALSTGENAHVIMFLEWTEDGRIRCIHESSGNVNNVTIGIRDAQWPFYRKLID